MVLNLLQGKDLDFKRQSLDALDINHGQDGNVGTAPAEKSRKNAIEPKMTNIRERESED
jgi:hypothetical protein